MPPAPSSLPSAPPSVGRAAVGRHPTPLGTLTLAATEEALLYCGFEPSDAVRERLSGPASLTVGSATAAQEAVLEEARAQLDAYLSGRLRRFSVPVDTRLASPFVRETVTALDDFVPYGRTGTYGRLALRLGRPGAARAVGTALGANPLCVILPCHRVIASSGRLTGYAGGPEAKRCLIELEAESGT